MTDLNGNTLPLWFAIIGVLISVAVAITAVVFSNRLKRIPEYIETIFHETGHALTVVPFGGKLPEAIDFFDGSEAEVLTDDSSLNPVGRWLSLLSGYAFPIVVGFVLIWLSFAPTVKVIPPLLIAAAIYVTLIFTPKDEPLFFLPRLLLTLGFFGSTLWLVFIPVETAQEIWGGEITGISAQLFLTTFVLFALFLGSIGHIGSLHRPESRRSLIVLGSVFGVIVFFFTLPAIANLLKNASAAIDVGPLSSLVRMLIQDALNLLPSTVAFAFLTLGLILVIQGVKTLINHRQHGGDFKIMTEDYGFSPMVHFLTCLISLLVSLFVVIWVLGKISFT